MSDEVGAKPVGSGNWTVELGDGMSYIAEKTGFFWKTLWDLPENAALADAREDPDVLLPGDKVTVPEPREKKESRETDLIHTFKRRGVPFLIRLFVLDEYGEAIANRPYKLNVGTRRYDGETGADGLIRHWVSPSAKTAKLQVMDEDDPALVDREWDIEVGRLEPENSLRGIQSRLTNLGYDCGEIDGELGPRTISALSDFQAQMGLEVTGDADQDTIDALDDAHRMES